MQENNNSKVDYLLRAAEHSRFNARHWLRYLRKEIVNGKVRLTAQEIDLLVNNDKLTMYQKISLKRAMTPGTPTYQFVKELNEPAKTPMLDKIIRSRQNGDHFR